MKLKIKPSAKIKRRYILIEGRRQDVEKAILEYIGVLGWARASPVFVDSFSGLDKGKIILSIDRGELVNVRAAFAVASGTIKVLRVSGTLNGLGK